MYLSHYILSLPIYHFLVPLSYVTCKKFWKLVLNHLNLLRTENTKSGQSRDNTILIKWLKMQSRCVFCAKLEKDCVNYLVPKSLSLIHITLIFSDTPIILYISLTQLSNLLLTYNLMWCFIFVIWKRLHCYTSCFIIQFLVYAWFISLWPCINSNMHAD